MQPKHHRDEIVRAVLGELPAIGAIVADPKRLRELSEILAQNEAAKQALCASGYGTPDMPVDAIVRLVLNGKGK